MTPSTHDDQWRGVGGRVEKKRKVKKREGVSKKNTPFLLFLTGLN